MIIAGLQKLTLLDFPGYIACTVFTQGCNMRCPFCHNENLVLPEKFKENIPIPTEDIMQFLQTRKDKLQGICITGGEPTMQKDLIDFISDVRELGYKIKLDTNGTNPGVLQQLFAKQMLDYVAMDIKNCESQYDTTAGCHVDINDIKQSINLIKTSGVDYEFRTTVTKELHSEEGFKEIGNMVGQVGTYSLQYYKESEHVINPIYHAPSDKQMSACANIMNYARCVPLKGR